VKQTTSNPASSKISITLRKGGIITASKRRSNLRHKGLRRRINALQDQPWAA
jgi:hypothetical protein